MGPSGGPLTRDGWGWCEPGGPSVKRRGAASCDVSRRRCKRVQCGRSRSGGPAWDCYRSPPPAAPQPADVICLGPPAGSRPQENERAAGHRRILVGAVQILQRRPLPEGVRRQHIHISHTVHTYTPPAFIIHTYPTRSLLVITIVTLLNRFV